MSLLVSVETSESKVQQMKNFDARQESDIMELLRYRESNVNENPSDSFWAHGSVVAPAASGCQCWKQMDGYAVDVSGTELSKKQRKQKTSVFVPGDYRTYTMAQLKDACRTKGLCDVGSAVTLRRYLSDPGKAKLAHDPSNKKTWSNDERRVCHCTGRRAVALASLFFNGL